MTLNEKIGFELRNQRQLKRLTLEKVAERMNVKSRNTISRIELGKKEITVEDLINYCDAVGCSWIELLQKVSEEK